MNYIFLTFIGAILLIVMFVSFGYFLASVLFILDSYGELVEFTRREAWISGLVFFVSCGLFAWVTRYL